MVPRIGQIMHLTCACRRWVRRLDEPLVGGHNPRCPNAPRFQPPTPKVNKMADIMQSLLSPIKAPLCITIQPGNLELFRDKPLPAGKVVKVSMEDGSGHTFVVTLQPYQGDPVDVWCYCE